MCSPYCAICKGFTWQLGFKRRLIVVEDVRCVVKLLHFRDKWWFIENPPANLPGDTINTLRNDGKCVYHWEFGPLYQPSDLSLHQVWLSWSCTKHPIFLAEAITKLPGEDLRICTFLCWDAIQNFCDFSLFWVGISELEATENHAWGITAQPGP